MSRSPKPPHVDAHAHIAPDVTPSQIRALGDHFVFAMTRSIDEARQVVRRHDQNLVWGIGTHPAVPDALNGYSQEIFERAIPHFSLVGEVGLDRRGSLSGQLAVFRSILSVCHAQPVLISVHSTGRVRATLEALAMQPHPGVILHWFNGTPGEIRDAVDMGSYFSVNAAMSPELVAQIPADRLLAETDFPSSRRRTQARRPGDVAPAHLLMARTHDVRDVPAMLGQNLRHLIERAGATIRMPSTFLSRLGWD